MTAHDDGEPPPPSGPQVVVDVSAPGVRLALSHAGVRRLAARVLAGERVRHAILSYAFVTPRAMTALNRRIFGRARATDVITLAFRPGGGRAPVIADIYIAPDVVRRNAAAADVPVREELARVVVHGALHALGMTHPDGTGRERSPMWRRQERLLAAARRDGLW